MRALLGYEAHALKRGDKVPVVWDFNKVMNPHILIAGASGAGKTHTIRDLIAGLSSTTRPGQRVQFHVFDVAGDMMIPGASTLLFSERTSFGLNPLRIDPDPDFGGVRRRVQSFIRTLNKVSTLNLGVKQEACLRNILFDVYAIFGFRQDDPSTWFVDESQSHLISDGSDGRLYIDVSKDDYAKVQSLGLAKWDPAKALFWVRPDQYTGSITQWPVKRAGRSYPTIKDVLEYARRLLVKSFMGADEEAVTCLEAFNRAATSYQRKVIQAARRGEMEWRDETLEAGLEKAAGKAIDAYTAYVGAIKTGRELDNLVKYDSIDTLKSVCDRLEGMVCAGIFKDRPIVFPAGQSILRYNLKPLTTEEKRMFVVFRLEELYAQAVQRGEEQDDVIDVFILDEFGNYATVAEDRDNIINVIAREGRKYSACLFCAHQDPLEFPDGFMSSVATKILLRVDENYWKPLATKMRVEERLLAWTTPGKSAGVQIKERGSSKSSWAWTVTPSHAQALPQGLRAA